jgi:GT2 family glycosyltransferase
MQTIAIVIVNWNGLRDTSVCLASVKELVPPKGYAVKTYVVDNGSTDDSVAIISKKYPWVTVLATGSNLGFTGGNNAGMKRAMDEGADFLWLVNNDTILDPHAADLVRAFDDDSIGIAGSKIYFAPGHEYHKDRYAPKELGHVFWYAGGHIDWDNMYASHRGVDEVDHGQYDTPEVTPFVTGCSFMIRSLVAKRIGLLDEHFYLYLEDLDWCLRAKKAGFTLRYYPKSVMWHVNAGSSGGPGNPLHGYYMTRNRLLVGMRYAPIRTKIALVRESLRKLMGDSKPEERQAIRDAFMGKWGKQYDQSKNTR